MLFNIVGVIVGKAQNNGVKYSSDFQFKNGFYTSYAEFKNNEPKITNDIINSMNPDFTILQNDLVQNGSVNMLASTLNYPDSGKTKEIKVGKLVGQSQNNNLSFFYKGSKYKTAKIGRLCLLYLLDDLYYNNNTQSYQRYQISLIPRQIMLDFETGEIIKFETDEFSLALKTIDPDLFFEFSQLSSRKKKEEKFIYLNKINDKHPIYFKL